MQNTMLQNFLYHFQFYFQLRITYSRHYIKQRKTISIFLLRMKQKFIKSLSSKIYPTVALRIYAHVFFISNQVAMLSNLQR